MMRYRAMFARLERAGQGALGAFLMLGDPDLKASEAGIEALVEGGADMLELGVPFSDPVADGPAIQAAANRALAAGVRPSDALGLIARIRARHPDLPMGVLTYANLVVARGRNAFYRAAADAGLDSVLVADAPVFEALPFVESARANGVAPVLIAAANTPDARLRQIARWGGGYTYCVARAGVTGADADVRLDHARMLAVLREAAAPPPVFGFGIATPAHVRTVLGAGAAGVISGSAIVEALAKGGPSAVRALVRNLKDATCR